MPWWTMAGKVAAEDRTIQCQGEWHTMRVYLDDTLVLLNHQSPATEHTLDLLGGKEVSPCLRYWHLHRTDRSLFWWNWDHTHQEVT